MATFINSLCTILMLTTASGLICRNAQLPEVIGQILVGILVGPSLLGVMHMSDSLSLFSDLGIIILMFLGGVGCDLQLLKKYSKAAVIIACMGVVFPVAVMGGVSLLFGFKPIPAAFIGVVFSATSVSISVAVLKEAGLLDSKEGVSILGAAVADDVIGVILLAVMCTLVNTGRVDVAGLGLILLKQVLFFVAAAVVVVWVAPALMTLAGVLKAPSGIAVMAVIICLAMAWASNLAGLSYAVGAFFAGIAVSNSDDAEDADRYIEPVGDTLFVPVFFVGIGLQTTGVDDTKMIVFIAIMTVLGVITKVVGCGLGGRMAGFGGASALMIGAAAGAKLGNGEHQATGGVFEGFGIEMKDESPSARPGLNSPLAQSLVSLVKERTGRDPLAKLGWTDVARFAILGIPAVNLGAGSPLLAHKQDEQLPETDLLLMADLLEDWLR